MWNVERREREENDVLLELVKLLLVQLSVKCLTETLAARDDIVCLVFVFFPGVSVSWIQGTPFLKLLYGNGDGCSNDQWWWCFHWFHFGG